jgi:hypothetical protein
VLSVSEADVTRVAQNHIDPARLLTVIVGDRERVSPTLAELDLGERSEAAIA